MTLAPLNVPGLEGLSPEWQREEERQRYDATPTPPARGTIASSLPAPAAEPTADKPKNKRRQWVDSLRPTADKYGSKYGIPAEALLAINASETNWGNADSLFGIKGKGSAGSKNYATWESEGGQRVDINDDFAIYNHPDEAYEHFFELVSTAPRYKGAWEKLQGGDWRGFLDGINAAGYATDPKWSRLIQGIASDISGGNIPDGPSGGPLSPGGIRDLVERSISNAPSKRRASIVSKRFNNPVFDEQDAVWDAAARGETPFQRHRTPFQTTVEPALDAGREWFFEQNEALREAARRGGEAYAGRPMASGTGITTGDKEVGADFFQAVAPTSPAEATLELSPFGLAGDLRRGGRATIQGLHELPEAARLRKYLQVPENAPEAIRAAETAGETLIPSHIPSSVADQTPLGIRIAGASDDVPDEMDAWRKSIELLQKEGRLGARAAQEANQAEVSQQLEDAAQASSGYYRDTARVRNRATKVSDLMNRLKDEAAARVSASKTADALLPDDLLKQSRANANIARDIGADPTQVARDVLKGDEGLTGPTRNRWPMPPQKQRGNLPVPKLNPNINKPGSFWETVVNTAQEIAGAPLALKTTISPALLRQGMVRLITSPRAALDETGRSVVAALREGDARAFQQSLLDHPWSSAVNSNGVPSAFKGFTAEDVGLKVRDWGDAAPPGTRTPGFEGVGALVGKLPHVRFSDRQYALEFNAHILNRYAEVAAAMYRSGERNKRAYEDLARVLEHQQHFGSWEQGKIPVFFSTRAISGRAEALLDLFRMNPLRAAQPGAVREAWKGAISMVAGNMAMMYAVAEALPGFDVDTGYLPPRLKTPVGTIDPWAGWSTIARLVYDVAEMTAENASEGNIDDLGPEAWERLERFIRGQESPTFSKLTDIATKKDFMGRDYSLTDDIKSGNLLLDMTAPMIGESIVEGFREHGLTGAVVAGGWEGISGSIDQAPNLRQMRDEEAQKQFGSGYDKLLPSQQRAVNETKDIAVEIAKRPKSDFKKASDEVYGALRNEQHEAEEAFMDGELSESLTTRWRRLSDQKKGARQALEGAFKKDLSKYEQDEFDRALDGYYGLEVVNRDGSVDWDRTEIAQQDYLAGLTDRERTWINDFLDTADQNASPLRQQYFDYLDQKESLGYFREDITAAEKAALDRQHPELDVMAWFFNTGVKDQESTPSLQSRAAVDQALALNLPNRKVKLAGLGRAVNENEGTLAAWKEYADRADKFVSGAQVDRYKGKLATQRYKKTWDELTDSQRSSIIGHIQTEVRKGSPDLDAYLSWMGRYSTLQSKKAGSVLKQIREKFGREPEDPDGPIRYANNAR